MQPQFTNGLLGTSPAFAVATPVFLLEQDPPAPKPGDQTKPKANRKLSDLEVEALKRIAKLDPGLSRKLGEKLPKKKTQKEQIGYLRKRVGKLDDERTALKGAEKAGFLKKKELEKRLKLLDRIQKELIFLGTFYQFGIFPEWYKKLLKEREKQKKTPASKPAGKAQPSTPSDGTPKAPNGLLLAFIETERGLVM